MKINDAYNIWAEQYDSNQNKTRDLDQQLTKVVLGKLEFNDVLELGCGTGKNTEWLVDQCETVTCLDFSHEMLSKAKEKIKSKKVQFHQTDLNNQWPVPDNQFDLVTSSLTLEHIENLDFIFQQAYRKLKIDGQFFISEYHPFKQYLGGKARFELNEKVIELETYVHHLSDFLDAAKKNKFHLIEIKECFDEEIELEIPRLISFVFCK